MISFVRWTLFLFIGLPFQLVFYPIYMVLCILFRVFVFERSNELKQADLKEFKEEPRHSAVRDNLYHNNTDDHGAFTQYGHVLDNNLTNAEQSLMYLVDWTGSFLRRYGLNLTQGNDVSGDVVVAWCFAYNFIFSPSDDVKASLKTAVDHYVANLGTISKGGESIGWVSSRCNNFGINYCPDGFLKLGQPMTGPQFYTTSALLSLASKELGGKYKLYFWLHWIVMGGWFWAWAPVLYTKNWKAGYVRDITMKALWVHLNVFGPKWWIIMPMYYITKGIAEYENALFFAMLGLLENPEDLPRVMDPFFSQRIEANNDNSDKANIWVRDAIAFVQQTSYDIITKEKQ